MLLFISIALNVYYVQNNYVWWHMWLCIVETQNENPLGTTNVHGAIDYDNLLEKASKVNKKNIKKKAFALILSNLFDKFLMEVSKENTPLEKVFSKLNCLYL